MNEIIHIINLKIEHQKKRRANFFNVNDRAVATCNTIIEVYEDLIEDIEELGTSENTVNGIKHNVVGQSEPLKCLHIWETIGHQLNGHQECVNCGMQKAF